MASAVGIAAGVLAAFPLTAALAVERNTTANVVLGQSSFTSNMPNAPAGLPTASNLAPSNASDVAIAPSGRVYVSDADNHRILSWPSAAALTNAQPADMVFGQPDFNSNALNNGGVSASSLALPQGVFVDAGGNLWVADAFNHRVLKFNNPQTDGTPAAADLVIGQFDFTHRDENLGFGGQGFDVARAHSLLYPGRVVVYGDSDVYIADSGNSRVLHYTHVTANTPTANRVYGQFNNFTWRGKNNQGNGPDGCCALRENMFNPIGIARDAAGRLYVADWLNHRMLRFDQPLSSTLPDAVLGQTDFFSRAPDGPDLHRGLHLPTDMTFDTFGRLFVADAANNRVVVYFNPLSIPAPQMVYGQLGDLGSQAVNHGLGEFAADADGLFSPTGVALDASGRLLVVDTNNSRVLRFDSPWTRGGAPRERVRPATMQPIAP